MRIKAVLITGIVFLVMLAGLCIPAFLAGRTNLSNLLLITPGRSNSPHINIQKIEDFSEEEFLLTYEITGAQSLVLPHASFPVTVIGTTNAYSQMLKSLLAEGSFFSKQAWDGKQRHAVLNETAAYSVFGSTGISGSRFRLGGDTWIVTGVIKDGDEDSSRVYVPSSTNLVSAAGGEALSLLALMQQSGGYDEAYIKGSIKTLGILEGDYNFFNLGTQIRLLRERIAVLLLAFFGLLFLSLLRPFEKKLTSALSILKTDGERHYYREIMQKTPKLIIKPALFAAGLFLCIVAALFLFLRAASIILPWQDMPSLSAISRELFYPRLLYLRNAEFASRLIFYPCAAVLAAFFAGLNILLNKKN